MAFDDLRSFLQELDDHGQLLKISEEVNAEPDLAAAANATGRIGDGAPALWFAMPITEMIIAVMVAVLMRHYNKNLKMLS